MQQATRAEVARIRALKQRQQSQYRSLTFSDCWLGTNAIAGGRFTQIDFNLTACDDAHDTAKSDTCPVGREPIQDRLRYFSFSSFFLSFFLSPHVGTGTYCPITEVEREVGGKI